MDRFFTDDALTAFQEDLARGGFTWEAGLGEAELSAAEAFVGARFPPDLRAMLAQLLPVGDGFPRWRRLDERLRHWLAWPLDGLLFDLEHNDLWLAPWGPAPDGLEARRARLRELVAEAPTMILVYGHRFLPAEPCEAGNAVLSMYQSDIIYYGANLASYLAVEFGDVEATPEMRYEGARPIRFWEEVMELGG